MRLTSSRCSGVELSVSLTGSEGLLDDAEARWRVVDAPLGTLLEVDGPLLFLALIWMTTLRTYGCIEDSMAAMHT